MKDIPLWLKYASAVAAVVGAGAAVWVFVPSPSSVFGTSNDVSRLSASVRASAIPVDDILQERAAKPTSLERQEFAAAYEGSRVYGVGSFLDIAKSGDSYLLALRTSSGKISCEFSHEPNTERRLLLMRKGQSIGFTGSFANATLLDGAWYIQDCTLETL